MIPIQIFAQHKPGVPCFLRGRRSLFFLGIILVLCSSASAQVDTASISGVIADQSGGIVVGAEVIITNADTNVSSTSSSNKSGVYLVTGLKPGRYRIHVAKDGFKGIDLTDLILNVQDSISRNFALQVGSASETVTVDGSGLQINTTDASVGTVVDHKYVENMPLNGRSFQDLILLTAGVVTNSPQATGSVGANGEFSVNGQRTESNNYNVDGVSANAGIFPNAFTGAPSLSGSLPAATVLGTTQGLVSVDALEEFRVQTSSYSAEYGRTQGGQFYFATRSGTNQWHGTAFDYLRNDAFDANDWFNGYLGAPKPPLRQNDFGGTLGGRVEIPRVYDGRDKTFFFFSYEGLRLLQPQAATTSDVPTIGLRTTPSALQPVLQAFPKPNGQDLGNGFAEYVASWSNPGQIDSSSIRLDHTLSERVRLFFRFSDTASASTTRQGGLFSDPANPAATSFTTRTYTFGATSSFSNRISNEFRLGYISNDSALVSSSDGFGGAQPVNLAKVNGLNLQSNPLVDVLLLVPSTSPQVADGPSTSVQKQWNFVDSTNIVLGRQQFRFGADYRRSSPIAKGNNPFLGYFFFSENSLQTNSVDLGLASLQEDARPIYTNFSLYIQDESRITSRLNVSLGLRWEVNPAPSDATGRPPYTVQGSSLSTLTLAPQGTPLWKTAWYNFAPRLGAAYTIRGEPGWETVVRGGGGVFFDAGQQLGSVGYVGPGFSSQGFFGGFFGVPASFPIPTAQATPPIVNPPVAPYSTVYAFPPRLQLPFTLQWNATIEQALGKTQSVILSYVGANGRRLLEQSEVQLSGPPLAAPINPNFTQVFFNKNGLTSDYNALQVRYQRRLSRGVQGIASYTWSHSIDYGSQNFTLPYLRGNSDFDVRHNFAAAVSYDLPGAALRGGFARALLDHWGLDDRFSARTGFPVTLQGATVPDPATGTLFFTGLNQVIGQPVYVYGSQCAAIYNDGKGCPGGRAINPAAFAVPSGNNTGTAARNFVRGFGAWQMDFAMRRDFPIYERFRLQFRAEAFNIFNHPSYGQINAKYCSPITGSPNFRRGCTFGQATSTLAKSLGVLSPLYQEGGPRSMQLALKLVF